MILGDVVLRPTTLRVLALALDTDLGVVVLTFDAIAAALEVAPRTVRRATHELAAAGYVRCGFTACGRRCVVWTTDDASVCSTARALAPAMVREIERGRPKGGPRMAQGWPKDGPRVAQGRPKDGPTLETQASIEPLINPPGSGEGRRRRRARKTRETPPPPPQQMLGLEGTESDDDRARAQAALRRLDAVIGRVWERRGTTHGFLAWDDRTLVGLAAALRRYPWDEIAACVAWSADEVADGRLKGAFFATTFRGSAFCRRHADWERAQARAQHEAIRSAERAAARAAQVDELAEASPEASGDGAPYEAWADMSEEALQRWRAEVRAELRPDDPQEATS